MNIQGGDGLVLVVIGNEGCTYVSVWSCHDSGNNKSLEASNSKKEGQSKINDIKIKVGFSFIEHLESTFVVGNACEKSLKGVIVGNGELFSYQWMHYPSMFKGSGILKSVDG